MIDGHLYFLTAGTCGSSTVSWAALWRSMHRPCSCTASSFTGYRTLMPPEVGLVFFYHRTQLQLSMKPLLFFFLPPTPFCFEDDIKEIQTRPHQRWRGKHVGDVSVLYISLLLFRCTCLLGQIGAAYINRTGAQHIFRRFPLNTTGIHSRGSRLNCCFCQFYWNVSRLRHTVEPKSLFHNNSLSHLSCGQNTQEYLTRQATTGYQCVRILRAFMNFFFPPLFCFSMSSLHQGLPGNASGLFIWNLVSGFLQTS